MPQTITLTLTDDEVAAVQAQMAAMPTVDAQGKPITPLTVEQWMNQRGKSDLAMMVAQQKRGQADVLAAKYAAAPPQTKAALDAVVVPAKG